MKELVLFTHIRYEESRKIAYGNIERINMVFVYGDITKISHIQLSQFELWTANIQGELLRYTPNAKIPNEAIIYTDRSTTNRLTKIIKLKDEGIVP